MENGGKRPNFAAVWGVEPQVVDARARGGRRSMAWPRRVGPSSPISSSLDRSLAFQRFAVRTNRTLENLSSKGTITATTVVVTFCLGYTAVVPERHGIRKQGNALAMFF